MNFYNDIISKRSLNELLNFLDMFNFQYKIEITLLNTIKKFLGFSYKIKIIAKSSILINDVIIECEMPNFKVTNIKGF